MPKVLGTGSAFRRLRFALAAALLLVLSYPAYQLLYVNWPSSPTLPPAPAIPDPLPQAPDPITPEVRPEAVPSSRTETDRNVPAAKRLSQVPLPKSWPFGRYPQEVPRQGDSEGEMDIIWNRCIPKQVVESGKKRRGPKLEIDMPQVCSLPEAERKKFPLPYEP